MIQIVRYSDTPVGAYDELLLIPGNFEVPSAKERGKARLRITRDYVSQRDTCYNGIFCPSLAYGVIACVWLADTSAA